MQLQRHKCWFPASRMTPFLVLLLTTLFALVFGEELENRAGFADAPVPPGIRTKPVLRLGIIGGGIGGTSLSWFVRERLQQRMEIVIFEKEKIGGRVSLADLNGHKYESGASIFHEKNRLLQQFLKEFNLEKLDYQDDGRVSGIANGSSLLFETTGWKLVDAVKALWRYGYSSVKLGSWVDSYISRFEKIYDVQALNCSYLRPTDILFAADPKLVEMLNSSLREYMVAHNFAENFIEEVAAAAMRANYNQGVDVPALVGSISLAGMTGPLYRVKGGNNQVAIKSSHAIDHVEFTNINTIENLEESNMFRLHLADGSTQDFDYVVLAAPLDRNAKSVQLKHFPDFVSLGDWEGSYQKTVATIVEGSLNTTYYDTTTKLDDVINVRLKDIVSSAGKITDVYGNSSSPSGQPLWKIFSTRSLLPDELSALFPVLTAKTEVDWQAYPNYLLPPKHLPPFAIYGGFFYLNAVEWLGSAMEMSLIAAKNIAIAIENEILGRHPSCPSSSLNGQHYEL